MSARHSVQQQRAALFLYLVATCLVHGVGSQETVPGSSNGQTHQEAEPQSTEKQWLKQLFLEAEKSFELAPGVKTECKRDFERYKTNMRNQSVWAVRMSESSEWPHVGLFAGMVDHLGNWRECLKVSSGGLRGQYCLVQASYDFAANADTNHGSSGVQPPDGEASVWDSIRKYKDAPIRQNRQKLRWALCVPHTCNSTELTTSLSDILQPIFRQYELNITVNVNPVNCDSKEARTFSAGFYMVSIFLLTFIIAVFICTIYNSLGENDDKDENKLSPRAISKDLSLIDNYKRLVNTSSSNENPCLHLLKLLSMIMIIIVHQQIFINGYPTFNTEDIEDDTYNGGLANENCVDVLFAISGFLTLYYGFEPMKKVGSVFAVISTACRWLRMIPIYCIVVLFVMYILPNLNSGPLWNQRIHIEVENCKASFWAGFFSVGNIINSDKQCLLTSWYIMVDVQLSIVGSLLLWIMAKNKKVGIFATTSMFITSSVIIFAVVYFNKRYNGLLLLYLSFLQEPRNHDEFNYFYTSTYVRIPPYIFGFVAGYAAKYLQELQYKFSKKQKLLLIVFGFGIKTAVIRCGAQFYKIERGSSVMECITNGIYAATSHWLYVAFDLLLIIICSTSCFAWLQKIKTIVIPLGRLTYSAFLTSTVVQFLFSAGQETMMASSLFINRLRWNCSDTIYIYFVGFLLHLFFEAPFSRILKRLLRIILRFFAKTEKDDASDSSSKSSYSDESTGGPETQTKSSDEPNHAEYDNKIFETDELAVVEESTH